jgi:[ribosomal protein S18]-alanine N-acetyltransferase
MAEARSDDARRHGDYRLSYLAWSDLHQVVALERLVFPEPIRPRQLVRSYLRPQVTYLAAHPIGSARLAAYYGFERLPDGHGAHVLANSTHPSHRRKGLARVLVTWGLELGRARGVRWIVGEVRVSNLAQLKFLKVMGWQVGERMPHFFGNGEDAWLVYHCLD